MKYIVEECDLEEPIYLELNGFLFHIYYVDLGKAAGYVLYNLTGGYLATRCGLASALDFINASDPKPVKVEHNIID